MQEVTQQAQILNQMMVENDSVTSTNDISLLSYNTTGWNVFKADFINTIMITHKIEICAIQEHFQLADNLVKIERELSNFEVFALPAYKSNQRVHSGRPSGGLAFIYDKHLAQYVTRLTVPNSFRVQGLKYITKNESILVINVYFPNDNRNNENEELIATLEGVKYLVDGFSEMGRVVLLGDLNCDFARSTNFVQLVKNFLVEYNLKSVWNTFQCDFTYSQSRTVNNNLSTCFSVIDHFCVSPEDLIKCVEATPLHFGANLSNHEPIYLKIQGMGVSAANHESNKVSDKKLTVRWNKAKEHQIQNYVSALQTNVNNITVHNEALFCTDVHCTSADHLEKLDDMSIDLMVAISAAVMQNIPHSGSSSQVKNIPGWKSMIQPLKDDADFWSAVWISAGKSQGTELHRVRNYTKNKYHHAIRKLKAMEKEVRKSNLLNACLDGDVTDLCKEIKRTRGSGCKSAGSIDAISDPKLISNHFRNIYNKVYNTHTDKDEVNDLIEENNMKIKQSDIGVVNKITPELVKKSIESLHRDKSDSQYDFKSDAFKVGVYILAEPFSDVLKAYLIHGHIPYIYLACSLIPIVKNTKESKLSSSNYRLIAITSLFLKLFDSILLDLCVVELKVSSMQLGFQKGCSTTMATWLMTETINYFTNRGGPVYLCLLDLTKAFDHVKFSTLFHILGKKIPAILLRFVYFSYKNQNCRVMWSGVPSEQFSVNNGVRQGSIASPTYFNLYVDLLFEELKSSGIGCKIDDIYYGAIAYADDFALLAPSREALQTMILIVEKFFTGRGITISTHPIAEKTKTKCLCFNLNKKPSELRLYDRPLPFVKSWPHLGHTISVDETPTADMELKTNQLIGKFHNLTQELGPQEPKVYMALINIYLLSLYGSSLWDLGAVVTDKVDKTWNSVVRQVFSLPFYTHRYMLNYVSGVKHLKIKLLLRFRNFYAQLKNSNRPEILNLLHLQERDLRSVFGRNCALVCDLTNSSSVPDADINSISLYPVPIGDEWKCQFVEELLSVRSGGGTVSQFTKQELDELVNFICK